MAANVVESAVSQQVAQFRGSVVDVNGEPLIGVNVLEKGTTNGTITDFDGNKGGKTKRVNMWSV